MNPDAVSLLDKIHADIWNISNNHIMDAGLDGLVNTRRLAGEHGAMTIGAGENDSMASVPVILSKQANLRHWEKSKLENVKEYILTMTSLR